MERQMRDYQQKRVYAWQRSIPSGGQIHIDQAQAVVNHIWEAEGLQYPPQVEPIHFNTTKWAGKANRLIIQLQDEVSLRTIIHEIAHSLTSNIEDESAAHGPWFVGVYAKLLEKYLHVPMPLMLFTMNQYGVDVDVMAHPIFLDD
jgi:hypothetical protein